MPRLSRFIVLLVAGTVTSCISLTFSKVPTAAPVVLPTTPIITQSPIAIVENPAAIGPDTFPAGINPLTGQPAADPASLNRRPIVVKISNAPILVRPQSGISAADLVYEHYVEGGLTRFSAIFYGEAPRRVGSIRSARLIDMDLVPMYQGLLAYSGASIGVEDLLNTSDFVNRLYKGVLFGLPYYWRDEEIEVPHNMFMDAKSLWDLADEQGVNQRPNLHGMAFLASAPAGANGAVNKIDLRYRATRIVWRYDAASGRYRRWADGDGHFDANTMQQITAENVVVIYADHELSDIVESQFQDSVSYGWAINLMGEGDATLFRDGLRYDGRWVRAERGDELSLRTKDGQLLYFKPGKTWFQVIKLPDQQNPQEEWLMVE